MFRVMIKLLVDDSGRHFPLSKVFFAPMSQAINLSFILRKSRPDVWAMIFHLLKRHIAVVDHGHIRGMTVNRNINTKMVYKHHHSITQDCAVSSIQSMIGLRTEQANLC